MGLETFLSLDMSKEQCFEGTSNYFSPQNQKRKSTSSFPLFWKVVNSSNLAEKRFPRDLNILHEDALKYGQCASKIMYDTFVRPIEMSRLIGHWNVKCNDCEMSSQPLYLRLLDATFIHQAASAEDTRSSWVLLDSSIAPSVWVFEKCCCLLLNLKFAIPVCLVPSAWVKVCCKPQLSKRTEQLHNMQVAMVRDSFSFNHCLTMWRLRSVFITQPFWNLVLPRGILGYYTRVI